MLTLEGIDFRQSQMSAKKVRLEPDGFLQQSRAFGEPFLLKTYGTENRTGHGPRFWIRQRWLDRLIGFLQPSLLEKAGGLLQSLSRIASPCGYCTQKCEKAEGRA